MAGNTGITREGAEIIFGRVQEVLDQRQKNIDEALAKLMEGHGANAAELKAIVDAHTEHVERVNAKIAEVEKNLSVDPTLTTDELKTLGDEKLK